MKKILTVLALLIVKELHSFEFSQKEIALKHIETYLGTPYRWGGDDPLKGFDCSGLAVEYLRSAGAITNSQDFTAELLYKNFLGVDKPQRGDLVFYENSSGKIIHVEIMLNNCQSIGASGGNSKTINENIAEIQNAYVKINFIYNRKGIAGFARPIK